MNDPDYVVIRDPEEESINGRWYDLRHVAPRPGMPTGTLALYTPTPFIEVRDDGAVAQVYMRAQEPEPEPDRYAELERDVARLAIREALRYGAVLALLAALAATWGVIIATVI